jgi:ATP-dependent RNA helicase DDX42
MGWFDESDNDDDDNEDNTAKKDIGEIPKKIPYEDDEDPLDAFMNALQKTPESKRNASRAERLDVDNDDDEEYQAFNEIRENDLDNWNDVTMIDPHSKTSLSDQKALSEKFVKAGSKKTNVSIQLDVVNHEKMQYFPFQKLLLNPQDTSFGREWRRQEGVTCSPVTMDPITSFESISTLLGKELLHRIDSSGYHSPTPVQAQTLAVALAGRDALVTASTGSGKTLAYVWPMVLHIQERNRNTASGPMGLILVPTREIATQVQKHVHTMIKSSIAIIGGVNRYELVQSLNRNPARIVVATPGRLLDVLSIKKNGFSLCYISFVVLDECDRMLDMGFESQVKEILLQIRPDRQSLLLSATLGRKIEAVAQKWLKDSIRYVKT